MEAEWDTWLNSLSVVASWASFWGFTEFPTCWMQHGTYWNILRTSTFVCLFFLSAQSEVKFLLQFTSQCHFNIVCTKIKAWKTFFFFFLNNEGPLDHSHHIKSRSAACCVVLSWAAHIDCDMRFCVSNVINIAIDGHAAAAQAHSAQSARTSHSQQLLTGFTCEITHPFSVLLRCKLIANILLFPFLPNTYFI